VSALIAMEYYALLLYAAPHGQIPVQPTDVLVPLLRREEFSSFTVGLETKPSDIFQSRWQSDTSCHPLHLSTTGKVIIRRMKVQAPLVVLVNPVGWMSDCACR